MNKPTPSNFQIVADVSYVLKWFLFRATITGLLIASILQGVEYVFSSLK